MNTNRSLDSYNARLAAADLARHRPAVNHQSNGDEQRYASSRYAMSFTKGLEHDADTGLISDPLAYESFRKAIDEGYIDAFTYDVPSSSVKGRKWEAPTAGTAFELQGPDPQAVTMPPAPALGSLELAFEIAEVYELALLRDTPLANFMDDSGCGSVGASVDRLNGIGYPFQCCCKVRPRIVGDDGVLTSGTVFRGSSPKVEVGPYLSQLLWIGNDQPGGVSVGDGKIAYGNIQIDQRILKAKEKVDYLTDCGSWLDAQNGKDLRKTEDLYELDKSDKQVRRFIYTPRDLATYVHDDALYEAYLNGCLILLGMGSPFDPAFDSLSGFGKVYRGGVASDRQAGGFALYGGPHILTLVTEVATRALKAVRFQKYNTHMRLRPEALAGRIQYVDQFSAAYGELAEGLNGLKDDIQPTLDKIKTKNNGTYLLPMAFQEGSPMHPSYGAGHATVAGACVTVLKAFFDTSAVLTELGGKVAFRRPSKDCRTVQFVAINDGEELEKQYDCPPLTLEGELNKLAANISIGRNMAGVHYFSDYYDSLRMGEAIAIGMLEEQALCYPTDPFVQTLTTFDGKSIRIGTR